jgi:hypothetical protein
MTKKIIGAVLLILGVFIALVLLTYGGPVFPHISGPVVFVTAGAFLLLPQRKGK